MDTSVLEANLSEAASRLRVAADSGLPNKELIQKLHSCEQELVSRRFVRRRDQFGGTRVSRVPEIESALIHVSQALTDLRGESIDHARSNIEDALTDLRAV